MEPFVRFTLPNLTFFTGTGLWCHLIPTLLSTLPPLSSGEKPGVASPNTQAWAQRERLAWTCCQDSLEIGCEAKSVDSIVQPIDLFGLETAQGVVRNQQTALME